MKTLIKHGSAAALIALGIGACAQRTPEALVQARRQYAAAEAGPAATMTPADLHQARRALDVADEAFAEEPGSQRAYDLAYVADRKARWAHARGAMALAEQARRQAESDAMSLREQLSEDQRRALEEARRAGVEGQRALQERERQLAATSAELEQLRKQSQEAQRDLMRLGQLRETERGLVITLSGNVLFESGKSDLLSASMQTLSQVADVLKGMQGRRVIVEGYTDSRGTDAFNRRLAEDRAEAVRDFLVASGVDSSMVRAEGIGESNPVASNESPEGRAMNRRVEIIIENQPGESSGAGEQR